MIVLPDSDDELLAFCDIQCFRSSGPGGQHVNKTDSAVRLIYRPLNLVVTCKEEKSQYLNKLRCLKKLREKVSKLNYRKPKRIPTRIPKSAKEKILHRKAKHSQKKSLRKQPVSQETG